ncbi:hypothetical protein XHV734_4866 [Xanthomonas hortorum pv. vitians]|nr:hypothetical protein XHV734_4866 [Xanthomonas hortorum pv. vitians]
MQTHEYLQRFNIVGAARSYPHPNPSPGGRGALPPFSVSVPPFQFYFARFIPAFHRPGPP